MINNKIQKYLELEKVIEKISNLNGSLKLLHWDMSVNLPQNAAKSRASQLSTLMGEILSIQNSSSTQNLIDAASDEIDNLNSWQRENLRLIKKSSEEVRIIPKELMQKSKELAAKTQTAWQIAKKNNDFKSLAPQIDELFNVKREIIAIRAEHFKNDKYKILVDDFDPDRTTDELDKIFYETKETLIPLIGKITEKQSTEKFYPLLNPIDKNTQKEIALRVMKTMGFNFNSGRLDESVHPFCIDIGNKDDIRITTSYEENNFLFSLYGVIHETGHALYERSLPDDYSCQPVGNAKGMGFHESQSLIMEKQVGTSKSFTYYLAKLLRDEFNLTSKEYSAENLFKLKTRVTPSLIRIKADEVTYPLHVILRYEIEKLIIEENLKAIDIPPIWNSKLQDYLGVNPTSEFDGCMQDIHWPSGMIGYFPSYYVGAIIASMVMKKAKESMAATSVSLDEDLRNGIFSNLNGYLDDNLRKFGSALNSRELLKSASGYSELNVDIFLNYIKDKYL